MKTSAKTAPAAPARKPMPDKNVWFEKLPRGAHVEERGAVNRYYVHVGPDGEAVVCWSSNTHPHAQATLDRMVRDTWRRSAVAQLKGAQ